MRWAIYSLLVVSSAFAKPLELTVDLREAPRHILHARLVVPTSPGPLTFLYPKWIPGEHSPNGPIGNLVGLTLEAKGRTLRWRRDPADMYAIHCEVPAGADAVVARYDYLVPSGSEGFGGAASTSAQLAILEWNLVVLYPRRANPRELLYSVQAQLPEGWRYGTALPVAHEAHGTVDFQPVTLETLVDSPLLAGAHFRVLPLQPHHELDLAADSAAALEMKPETEKAYARLVTEAVALFGAQRYRSYHFLLALSDAIAHFGLEHHESSDNRAVERMFLDEEMQLRFAGLLPHEFAHSWNGKYRRPAGLATGDFERPMQGNLLWIYEGLTDYLGHVLTVRSGLLTPEQGREALALAVAGMANQPGRSWRSIEDTAAAAQILYGTSPEWESWRRGVDFYPEGGLFWLEADARIRELTQGQRSLDDFCHRFHGDSSGPPAVSPYTLDEVVKALDETAHSDWRGLIAARVEAVAPEPPLHGLTASGWKLVYTDKPNLSALSAEKLRKKIAESFSIGLVLRDDGTVIDAIPGMAAATAGVAPGMKVVAINQRRFTAERLRDVLRRTPTQSLVELIVENGDYFRTLALHYSGGLRYPHLERDPKHLDRLSEIWKPRIH